MTAAPFASKTLGLDDMRHPQIAPVARALRRFAMRLGVSGVPFAVNGVLRRRVWVRPHKMWEYARGVACVLENCLPEGKSSTQRTQRGAEGAEKTMRVLDFGGGATLPVFYLAHCGCEVVSLDVDEKLTAYTNEVAARRGWALRGSTFDLTRAEPTLSAEGLGKFAAVMSFSVLEHIRNDLQPVAVQRLAALLAPGGVFALTFDYGEDAPVENAIRSEKEVAQLVAATGLEFLDAGGFSDTGERFALDKRHARRKFTFASLFLRKQR